MPFIISKAVSIATAAVVATAPIPQQYTYDQQCYYVPVTHVYVFDVYQTMELECKLVPVPVRSR